MLISLVLASFIVKFDCYRCSTSSRYANKADKACVYGYSIIEKQSCPSDHVCSTYQYEVSVHGLIKSTVTIRGCQPYESVEDCDDIFDEIRELLFPARVREINCYSCNRDLCNGQFNT